MPVQKMDQTIGGLIGQVTAGEIRLPELQREYVWKGTQVAKLVDSLYQGFPTGSLLFWDADEAPVVREMAVAGASTQPLRAPLYLLDGQQRLTSLHRVFTDHPEAQIVFNADKERFQNQSAATLKDPKWIKVSYLLDTSVSMRQLSRRIEEAGYTDPETEIDQRLDRVRGLRERSFHVEVLKGFPYEQVAEIFVRVNSAGRRLNTLDLATATLSYVWPGVLGKLESEATHWGRQGYPAIGVSFLSRAFAGVVLGGGLSAWSQGRLANATEQELEQGWATVRRGLAHLVPLLRSTIGLTRSDPLPSMVVLIPLVVLLGEREDERLDEQTANALVYWLLVATMRARYSGSTDTRLSQDIRATRAPDPVRALFAAMDLTRSRPRVTPEMLVGRTKESAYFFLSLLAVHRSGAKDWWYGTDLLSGQVELEHHYIHPASTLDERYRKTAADIANLVFVSPPAGRTIGARSPRDYFAELKDGDLAAHLVPVQESLRDPEAFQDFLVERRRLLAAGMTDLLDHFRPTWLDRLPVEPVVSGDRPVLALTLYASAWEPGRLVFTATGAGPAWVGSASMAELEQTVAAVARIGIDSDIEIGGESVPVRNVQDSVEVEIGPFRVTGSEAEWQQVLDREKSEARPLTEAPAVAPSAWTGERRALPVVETL